MKNDTAPSTVGLPHLAVVTVAAMTQPHWTVGVCEGAHADYEGLLCYFCSKLMSHEQLKSEAWNPTQRVLASTLSGSA